MKKIAKITALCVLLFACFACASGGSAQKTLYSEESVSENSASLDTTIASAASYFIPQISAGTKVAIVRFDAPTGHLSDYVFEELWGHFEDSQKFIMVDRRNLDRIETEIKYQYGSGKVDDDLMVSITKQYGAEILVHGQLTPLGQEYRLMIYATDVEKATSSQRAFAVRPDARLAALLNTSPDEEVERAVSVMARAVDQKTTVALGRISYADTQSVSGLSAWLKTSIISGAQKQRDKLQIATESESADFAVSSRGLTVETAVPGSSIQAVITGNYSPLDNDAEVSLHLISTGGNKAVLASTRFIIPAAELERRKLTMLPEKDNSVISKAEFEAKQQAVAPYAGGNNRWPFTVTPDVLDSIYLDGDYMTLQVHSAQDCYFRIIHVDVNGNTQVIYPTSARDNNFIRAGQTRRIPDNTRYRMGAPFGEELILAAAYTEPFALSGGSGSTPLSADSITRGLTVETSNQGAISPAATAKFSYTILPR